MHVHTSWHTHAHHAHLTDIYARIYTCTHCGRKVHLAKFCFNRINHLNYVNKNVWVPYNTNPHGAKKKI